MMNVCDFSRSYYIWQVNLEDRPLVTVSQAQPFTINYVRPETLFESSNPSENLGPVFVFTIVVPQEQPGRLFYDPEVGLAVGS
jgi:hypothetical protein